MPGLTVDELLEGFKSPLLLLWGELDPWIRPAAADKIQACYQSRGQGSMLRLRVLVIGSLSSTDCELGRGPRYKVLSLGAYIRACVMCIHHRVCRPKFVDKLDEPFRRMHLLTVHARPT